MKNVFITGASTGLGYGLAKHWAGPGVQLTLVARRKGLLEEHKRVFEAEGAAVAVWAGDVAETAFMQEAVSAHLESFGAPDVVLANAGIGIKDTVKEGNAADIAHLMGINVIGVTNTVVPFVPAMLARGRGVLCATGSFAGHRALPRRAAYSASKACVNTFMDALRMDLHGTGVHAMTICPGFVKTPLTEDNPEMFFVVELEDAVKQMARAIETEDKNFTFPWQMNVLKHVVKRAPERLLRRLAPQSRTAAMPDHST